MYVEASFLINVNLLNRLFIGSPDREQYVMEWSWGKGQLILKNKGERAVEKKCITLLDSKGFWYRVGFKSVECDMTKLYCKSLNQWRREDKGEQMNEA